MGVEVGPDWDEPSGTEASTASHQGAQQLGLAGTVSQHTVTRPAGMTRLGDSDFGGGPTTPMVPSTWR